jgi:acyl-coenzyme A thioesterase PaaI-like protein
MIDFLKTDRKEAFSTRRFRFLMNCYPMYFGTGGKIIFWSSDSHEVHLKLRLSIWTRNLVGTMFGGSMFAAADPFYMIMLTRCLGNDYVVWDKSASIRFRRPGKSTLYAKFELSDELLDNIKKQVAEKGETEHTFIVQWLNTEGVVHAESERHCYIADKAFYQKKKGETQKIRFK